MYFASFKNFLFFFIKNGVVFPKLLTELNLWLFLGYLSISNEEVWVGFLFESSFWSGFGLLQQVLPLLNHFLQVVSQNLNPIRIRSLESFEPVVTFVFFFILLYVLHVTVFISTSDQRVVLLFHTDFFLQQLFVVFLKMKPTHFFILT